jgi:hypothetical protein
MLATFKGSKHRHKMLIFSSDYSYCVNIRSGYKFLIVAADIGDIVPFGNTTGALCIMSVTATTLAKGVSANVAS